jgi:hypothetical protein
MRRRTFLELTMMTKICDEFEAYGYRRVGAELRHRSAALVAHAQAFLRRHNSATRYV